MALGPGSSKILADKQGVFLNIMNINQYCSSVAVDEQ